MTEPAFTRGGPEVLFTGRYISAAGRKYDISPAGQQFLMVKEARQRDDTSALTQLIVLLNWFEELKRRVPGGK